MAQRKLAYLRTFLALPASALAFGFTAAVAALLATPTGAHLLSAPAASVASPASPDLAQFCVRYWGELTDGDTLCRFDLAHDLRIARVGRGAVVTPIQLVEGDTVTLESARYPEAIVASAAYDAADSFVVRAGGYLAFRAAEGQDFFNVERVHIARCYGASEGRVAPVTCPSVRLSR